MMLKGSSRRSFATAGAELYSAILRIRDRSFSLLQRRRADGDDGNALHNFKSIYHGHWELFVSENFLSTTSHRYSRIRCALSRRLVHLLNFTIIRHSSPSQTIYIWAVAVYNAILRLRPYSLSIFHRDRHRFVRGKWGSLTCADGEFQYGKPLYKPHLHLARPI